MAEVKWQARRVSDSVLVDVTADVEGVPVIAPTPNAIVGGAGEQTIRLLTASITFSTPGLWDDGLILGQLNYGDVVIRAWAVTYIAFGVGRKLEWYLAFPDYNGTWKLFENADMEYVGEPTASVSTPFPAFAGPATVRTNSHPNQGADLVYILLGGQPATGSADIYALIAEPAS